MQVYRIHVTIENKAGISDPEGDTILNDLVLERVTTVKRIRTAKMLRFEISAESGDDAIGTVRRLCDELRLYNPVVSTASVEIAI